MHLATGTVVTSSHTPLPHAWIAWLFKQPFVKVMSDWSSKKGLCYATNTLGACEEAQRAPARFVPDDLLRLATEIIIDRHLMCLLLNWTTTSSMLYVQVPL